MKTDTKQSGNRKQLKEVNDTKKKVGLKRLRQENGLTQTQLAEKSGLSQQAVSDYEVGNRTPSLEAAEKLALGLATSMEEIVKAVKEQRQCKATS